MFKNKQKSALRLKPIMEMLSQKGEFIRSFIMSTTCKWKLVSLTSATTNTTMVSIYKNDHNKVCGGSCGRRIRLRVYKNPAQHHHVSTWFQSHQYPVKTVGDLLFLLWLYLLTLLAPRGLFLNSLTCQSTVRTIFSTWVLPTHSSESSSNITFSDKPSLAINPHIPRWIRGYKIYVIYILQSVSVSPLDWNR